MAVGHHKTMPVLAYSLNCYVNFSDISDFAVSVYTMTVAYPKVINEYMCTASVVLNNIDHHNS